MSTHCLRVLLLFARCHHQKLKWDELAARKIAAPFKPKIKNEMDTSNFSDEFTTMVPADSPAVVPLDGEKIFKVRACVRAAVCRDRVRPAIGFLSGILYDTNS